MIDEKSIGVNYKRLKKTNRKIDLNQRMQRYACVDRGSTRKRVESVRLVMLERAQGGCLGTESR